MNRPECNPLRGLQNYFIRASPLPATEYKNPDARRPEHATRRIARHHTLREHCPRERKFLTVARGGRATADCRKRTVHSDAVEEFRLAGCSGQHEDLNSTFNTATKLAARRELHLGRVE